jgi:CheY-like chemotaxis protein
MPATLQPLRILLVENDPDDVFFLERALAKEGFREPLTCVRDGAEAISYLENLSSAAAPLPDVVLTDINMPRVNGIDLLRWLREQPQFQALPVIVLTSSNEQSDRSDTQRLGVFKFITKQVSYENITATLKLFARAR